MLQALSPELALMFLPQPRGEFVVRLAITAHDTLTHSIGLTIGSMDVCYWQLADMAAQRECLRYAGATLTSLSPPTRHTVADTIPAGPREPYRPTIIHLASPLAPFPASQPPTQQQRLPQTR